MKRNRWWVLSMGLALPLSGSARAADCSNCTSCAATPADCVQCLTDAGFHAACGCTDGVSTCGATSEANSVFHGCPDPDFAVVGRRQLMSNANFMSSQRVHANYDVTADGQHLVVISVRFADVGSRPVIVTNWFEELRERLGN